MMEKEYSDLLENLIQRYTLLSQEALKEFNFCKQIKDNIARCNALEKENKLLKEELAEAEDACYRLMEYIDDNMEAVDKNDDMTCEKVLSEIEKFIDKLKTENITPTEIRLGKNLVDEFLPGIITLYNTKVKIVPEHNFIQVYGSYEGEDYV